MKKLKIKKIVDLIDEALDILYEEREKEDSLFDSDSDLDTIYSNLLSAHDALINDYDTKY